MQSWTWNFPYMTFAAAVLQKFHLSKVSGCVLNVGSDNQSRTSSHVTFRRSLGPVGWRFDRLMREEIIRGIMCGEARGTSFLILVVDNILVEGKMVAAKKYSMICA